MTVTGQANEQFGAPAEIYLERLNRGTRQSSFGEMEWQLTNN